jgi:hypothetical protein
MQSSTGCVRAISTQSSYLAAGLMQRYGSLSLSHSSHRNEN